MRRKGFIVPQLLAFVVVLICGLLILFLIKPDFKGLVSKLNPSTNSTQAIPSTSSSSETYLPSPKPKIFKNGEFNTYKNEAYGIEFTYPSEWELDDHNAPTIFDSQKDYVAIQININNRGTGLSTIPGGTCPATYAGIQIHVGNSRKLPTLAEDIDLRLTQGLGTRDMWGNIVPSTFNNYKSLTVERIEKSGCINTTIDYVEQDKNYYSDIGVSVGNSTNSNDKQYVDAIVKSIKISAPQY